MTIQPPPDQPGDDAITAAGADTLMDVLQLARDKGYTVQLTARQTGQVECGSCNEMNDPATIKVNAVRRLEGATDPADEMLIAAAHCPNCGSAGVLTLGHGPNASEADSLVLESLDIHGAPVLLEAAGVSKEMYRNL